jgi:hypothetical protein
LSSWKQSLKTRRVRLGIAGLGGLGLVLYALSPFLAVWDFGSAMASGNAEKSSSYIDFVSLRESLKVEGLKVVVSNMNDDPDLQANPFNGLAYAMAGPIINSLVDNYVTPAGLKALLEKDSVTASGATEQERAALDKLNTLKSALGQTKLGYKSFNTFDVTSTDKFNRKLTLVFKREGIASWKLVEVEIPPDGYFSP